MPNPYFKFKQFTVYHDRCAMKVGTDGVLLGAWTEIGKADSVLDVGVGSGLISLMLAQRNPEAYIAGIEIDEEAAIQANRNYQASSFKNLDKCINVSLQDFFISNNSVRFDLIVSNPPFFSRSLKSPDKQRTKARHSDSLPIEDFVSISAGMLSDKGKISFIFPSDDKDYLLKLASANDLSVSRVACVYSTPVSDCKRLLLEFSKEKSETEESDLVIETSRHHYSDEFVRLVKDFYLNY